MVAPRVNDKRVDETTGERKRFASAVLAPWCRKSPKVNEVLPLLYLHGLSSSDFVPALQGFLGTSSGLSPATITRLTVQWREEAVVFNQRDLSIVDYVYDERAIVSGCRQPVALGRERRRSDTSVVALHVRNDGPPGGFPHPDGSFSAQHRQ